MQQNIGNLIIDSQNCCPHVARPAIPNPVSIAAKKSLNPCHMNAKSHAHDFLQPVFAYSGYMQRRPDTTASSQPHTWLHARNSLATRKRMRAGSSVPKPRNTKKAGISCEIPAQEINPFSTSREMKNRTCHSPSIETPDTCRD